MGRRRRRRRRALKAISDAIIKKDSTETLTTTTKVPTVTKTTTTIILPMDTEPITKKLTIEVCMHCYNYQKRLCWMLSSLLQEKGDKPNIVANVSYTPNNGNPTTESVIKLFREKGLVIKETILTKEQIHNRAIARNIQIKESQADWILFADCDMVYDSLFFSDLQKQLQNDLRNETRVMGADRLSLSIPFCIKYFEEDKREYPCEIENVADITSKWPVWRTCGGGTAPGNFQLAKMSIVRARGSRYSFRQRDRWRRTASDRHFRLVMKGRVQIKTKPQYHLNHDRGGPELQR